MLRDRLRPLWVGLARGGGFLVVALVGIAILHAVHWYPRSLDDYRWTALLIAVCIGVGRRFPMPLLIGVAVCVGFPLWDFNVMDVRVIPLVLATYFAMSGGAHLGRTLAIVTAATFSAAFPFFITTDPRYWIDIVKFDDLSTKVLAYGLVVAGLLLGRAAMVQRHSEETLQRRNEELVRLRAADQERIANEERTRIAREIHDVVAHHMAAIVIRAQAAARVGADRPDQLQDAVEWIAVNGQDALSEIRSVVRVLRGSEQGGTTAAPIDLADALRVVFERVSSTGVDVDAHVSVPPGLTSLQDFAVLRVCQEALTNVLIHSDASHVRVTLDRDEAGRTVTLAVDDDGFDGKSEHHRAGSVGSGGAGVRGMRERAASVGGRLVAGPTARGWKVELTLPYDPADAVPHPIPLPVQHRPSTAASTRQEPSPA
jgi:signal transduction histidine kinase